MLSNIQSNNSSKIPQETSSSPNLSQSDAAKLALALKLINDTQIARNTMPSVPTGSTLTQPQMLQSLPPLHQPHTSFQSLQQQQHPQPLLQLVQQLQQQQQLQHYQQLLLQQQQLQMQLLQKNSLSAVLEASPGPVVIPAAAPMLPTQPIPVELLPYYASLNPVNTSDTYSSDSGNRRSATLYVRNFTGEITESVINSFFGKFGKVAHYYPFIDKKTRQISALFVHYKHVSAAKLAKKKLDGYIYGNVPLSVEFAKRNTNEPAIGTSEKSTVPPSRSVFVGGLPFAWTKKQLSDVFSRFGEIEEIRQLTKNGNPSGIAFIDFDSMDSATAAIDELDETTVDGRILTVNYATKSLGIGKYNDDRGQKRKREDDDDDDNPSSTKYGKIEQTKNA